MGGGDDIKQPADFSGQDSNFSTLSNQTTGVLNGYAPQIAGQASGITNSFLTNPYAGAAQTGAATSGAYGTGTVTPLLQQGATALQGIGNQAASYIPQAYTSGFDPQNALYNRNFQQSQDQQSSINAQNGVSGTPYGASVSGMVGNNFNLDWQNQAQARQAQAAQTAAQLSQVAGVGYTGAGTLGDQAIQTGFTSAGLPSQQYQNNLAQQLAALSGENTAVGGATQMNNAQMSAIMNYLNTGVNASQAQAQVDAQSMAGLGSLFGSLLGSGGGQGAGSSIFSDAILAL